MDKLQSKKIKGYEYFILDDGMEKAVIETVPEALSWEWLHDAAGAKYLLLCGNNPFPESVGKLLETQPELTIISTPYIAYTLGKIIGREFPSISIRNGQKLSICGEELAFQTKVRFGEPAGLSLSFASSGERLFDGEQADVSVGLKEQSGKKLALLPYVSGLSFTAVLAQEIEKGIRDAGAIDVICCDLAAEEPEELLKRMDTADALIVGTPTVRGEAAKEVLNFLSLLRGELCEGMVGAAFGSHVWSDEGVPHVVGRLKQLKMDVSEETFHVPYAVGDTEKKSAYEFGYGIGCKILGIANDHKSKLLKCLVCGEIFEASLGRCPVCGVGPEQCVPVDEEEVSYHEDTERAYVIIGGGAAAVNAAEAIRKRDKTGRIRMLSAEEDVPINRPMLTKNLITAALLPDKLALKERTWYDEQGIDLLLNTKICAIEPEKRQLVTEKGERISYDRLIFATGAECFEPPIKGKEKPEVFSIRHMSDVRAIWSILPCAKNVVVIGGGVLGLEAASEFRKNRKNVTVLEMAPVLMGNQLDPDTSAAVKTACEKNGVPVLTGVTIEEIEGAEHVTGVRLGDGNVIPADLVILSCGMRAQTALAQEAGAECERAIVVNARMETTLTDIFACGDCAQHNGVNFQLWTEATEQGRIAGANAAGDDLRYENRIIGMDFAGMKTEVYAVGEVGNKEREYRVVEEKDEVSGTSLKLWFADGLLRGAAMVGDTGRMQELTDAVNMGKSYFEVMKKG